MGSEQTQNPHPPRTQTQHPAQGVRGQHSLLLLWKRPGGFWGHLLPGAAGCVKNSGWPRAKAAAVPVAAVPCPAGHLNFKALSPRLLSPPFLPSSRRSSSRELLAHEAPMGSLVAKLLLPTLSSLVFLPTISIAAKRRFHMEAMVYFFTMFFVAFYHVCDGPGLSVLCFMRYDILEYFSIYGTALSIWVSLMALAEFDEPKRSTFIMFGVLTIAVRIYHDRWGYGVYSGPIGTAVLVITVKWLQKMKEKKGLYPDKSVYTQQIGPGFCFGALALMLRFFFEEWDYTYVHSFYHCALAMALVLLLPKENKKAGSAGTPARLDCSTLCCCV
uniref:Myomaker, myoblast fusion factor n=42 Tax=Passeriformes TaxID=9126 RepID=U3JFR6_FICAL